MLSFDPPSIPGLGTTGGFEFQVEDLTGRGSFALNEATQALIAEARKQPELNPMQLFSSFSTSTPQFKYDLDRTKAKLLGLNVPDVFNTLQIYLGSLYVNDFNLFGRTFRVTLQADTGLPGGGDRSVAALCPQLQRRHGAALARWACSSRSSARRRCRTTTTTPPRWSMAAPRRASARGRRSRRWNGPRRSALPRDFAFEWTGITYQELKAGSIAMVVFALAIVFVFLILAAQYESWSMPFMVLLAVPLALFGAFLALFVRGLQTDVYSQIGFVMLIGLVGQERHSDRRVRQAAAPGRLDHRRCRDGSGAAAAAADPDDGVRLHPRRRSADDRERGGRGQPAIDRHHRVRRHARRDDPDAAVRSGVLRRRSKTGASAAIQPPIHAPCRTCSGRMKFRKKSHAKPGKSCWAASPSSAWRPALGLFDPSRAGGRRGAVGPAGDAGAGHRRGQEDDPGLSRLFGAHRIDPRSLAAGQGRRLHPGAAGGRWRRRQGRRSALQDRRPRLPGGARSGQGAGAAQCRRARATRARTSTAATNW